MNALNKITVINLFVHNEFFYKYLDLIKTNLTTPYTTNKTHAHHIIPESYFKSRGLPENNDSTDVVNLTYSDHVLAHYYLALCSIGSLHDSMAYAFKMMINMQDNIQLKTLNLDLDKCQQLYEDAHIASKKLIPPNKGKKMSEEQKLKIKKALLGHTVSKKTRQKQRKAQLNMSAENRAKITAGTRARTWRPTEKHKQILHEKLINHPVSEITRNKISQTKKLQHLTYI